MILVHDKFRNKAFQVVELEESRNNRLKEEKQLMENIDSLQFQIKDLKCLSTTRSFDELKKVCFLNLLICQRQIQGTPQGLRLLESHQCQEMLVYWDWRSGKTYHS